jgi:hypothetical protein
MRLTDEQITSYQKIYFETFGVRVSKEDALVQALALVRLAKVLAVPTKPINKDMNNEQRIRTDRNDTGRYRE